MKTAGRILGSAFFREGFEVQDAPRYGAERRGAPIFATVRAAREPIHERGAIQQPDLVIVADDTLVPIAAAGVLSGLTDRSVLLIHSDTDAATWKERLKPGGDLLVLSDPPGVPLEPRLVGTFCAGAAARLLGVLPKEALEQAIREELTGVGDAVLEKNLAGALSAYEALTDHEGCIAEGEERSAASAPAAGWIELPLEEASISAPDIHGAATSLEVRTGLWRTMRPVIDHEHCRGCHWVCGSLCPDGAISVQPDGHPSIDYEHCKGCLVCVAVCAPHAIRAVPESQARDEEGRP
jgi:pyruvate ferredoxin oxidoreductase gamma subunit